MGLREDYTALDPVALKRLLHDAVDCVEDTAAVPMVLAVAFEYALLIVDEPAATVEEFRRRTLTAARAQAAELRKLHLRARQPS